MLRPEIERLLLVANATESLLRDGGPTVDVGFVLSSSDRLKIGPTATGRTGSRKLPPGTRIWSGRLPSSRPPPHSRRRGSPAAA